MSDSPVSKGGFGGLFALVDNLLRQSGIEQEIDGHTKAQELMALKRFPARFAQRYYDASACIRLTRSRTMEESVKADSALVPARVLVIEDNSSDVFLLEQALNQHGLRFDLIHLADGVEALAFIRREGSYADAATPDLILVDLNLLKCDGVDILREIRAAQHLAGVLLCAWSSSRSRQDRALLVELGVDRFITKPSGLEQFMEIGKIIKDLLRGHTVA